MSQQDEMLSHTSAHRNSVKLKGASAIHTFGYGSSAPIILLYTFEHRNSVGMKERPSYNLSFLYTSGHTNSMINEGRLSYNRTFCILLGVSIL